MSAVGAGPHAHRSNQGKKARPRWPDLLSPEVFRMDFDSQHNRIEAQRSGFDSERKNNTIGRPDAACGGW